MLLLQCEPTTRAALLAQGVSHQEEHLVRSVSTDWCLPALPEMCQSRGSLPCSQPADLFPAFFIRICLLLWLCLGPELWVSLMLIQELFLQLSP